MPRVFVVQEQPHMNISPAMDYGKLVYMIGPGEHGFNPKRAIDTYRACLQEHSFECGDFLLLIGDPILIGCAVAITDQWLQSRYGTCTPESLNVLKWDRENKIYIHLELPLAI